MFYLKNCLDFYIFLKNLFSLLICMEKVGDNNDDDDDDDNNSNNNNKNCSCIS